MRFHPFLDAVCAAVRYLIDLDFCHMLKLNDAITKPPPTHPRSATVRLASVNEPNAAPNENPRYMKDALRERMTDAPLSPETPINRACCAGKKLHAANPQTDTATRTGTRVFVRVRNQADSEKLVSATAKSGNATAMT